MLESPPRDVTEFNHTWRDWLWFQYRELLDTITALAINDTMLIITTGSTAYTVQSDDEVIFANPTSGVFTVTLPVGTESRTLHIKNINTTNSNIVTVDGWLSETIDENADFTLDPLEAIRVIYSGTNTGWFII